MNIITIDTTKNGYDSSDKLLSALSISGEGLTTQAGRASLRKMRTVVQVINHAAKSIKTEEVPEKFYGVKDQERLDSSPEVVIESTFNMENVHEYAFPFKVYVFSRNKVNVNGEDILDHILEQLDENYSDPDGDPTSGNERMKKAAEAFALVIQDEYVSWMCEPTSEVIEYSKKNILKMMGE